MNVEIINTSPYELSEELVEALESYAPYHNYREERNRLYIDTFDSTYDIRCAMIRVDKSHVMIWISDFVEIHWRD